jgi:hypothetical protein
MWLSDLLWRLCGFAEAYLKNFRDAGFDLLRAIGLTKSQLGRFYWVNLIVCAFVLYYLFDTAQWLRKFTPLEGANCYPSKSLPVLALFLLAEVASFILLVGSQLESWLLYRSEESAADHAILRDTPSRTAAARRLHRLLWTWFPLVLGVAVYISASRFDGVADWCRGTADHYSLAVHRAKLIWAIIPQLALAFLTVAAVNWLIYRWSPSRKLAITLLFGFLFYVLAVAITGPADILGLVNVCRQLPDNIDWILKALIGK